jgi:hypothetical protein
MLGTTTAGSYPPLRTVTATDSEWNRWGATAWTNRRPSPPQAGVVILHDNLGIAQGANCQCVK